MFVLTGDTHIGKVRKSNQDRFAISETGRAPAFLVLCDGMGGENGGGVAAQTTVDFVSDMLRRDLRPGLGESSLRGIVKSAVAGANALVFDAAKNNPSLTGMGTTLVVAVFVEGHVFVATVGDSRAYHRAADGEVRQLTKDHTVVQMLLDMGDITEEEALVHPERHYITRAVGVAPTVEADMLEHEFSPGDSVLLCSDGLYNYYVPGALGERMAQAAAGGDASLLIGPALDAGGGDNITAVLAYWPVDD